MVHHIASLNLYIMACSETKDLSIETLKYVIRKLSPDEKEKALLLTGKAEYFTIDGLERMNAMNLVTNAREYWTEIVFVLQRYDLLKQMHLSDKDAFKQVENRSYFPIERRLLVKIYGDIPEAKEEEFCRQIRKEIFQSDESSVRETLAWTLLRIEEFIHSEGFMAFSKLKDVLVRMELNGAVSELDRYCKCNNISTSTVNFYPMEQSPCGKCLLINNKNFKDEQEREGSEIDLELLVNTFKSFDFIVECFNDLSSEDMLDVLRKAAEADHSNFCAFVCCIMSHGENDVVYGTDGHAVKIHDIRMTFCRCKTLIGKPKIFFYQACRGQSLQRGNMGLMTDGPANAMRIEDSQKDCLTGMATVEGSVAFRTAVTGSWFIQALVKRLTTAKTLSEAQILVNADVAKLQISYDNEKVSQTSEWVSTLTRDVKFRKVNS